EAGSSQRLSRRLSRMSACGSFATPWMTLIRSYTTRRSAPITRSRLRSPTSKSTTATFCPACANAAPSAAVDVVFPTPPLPDVTPMTLAISAPFRLRSALHRSTPSIFESSSRDSEYARVEGDHDGTTVVTSSQSQDDGGIVLPPVAAQFDC